jgi:hypothetical protein
MSYGMVLIISPAILEIAGRSSNNIDGTMQVSLVVSLMALVFLMKFASMYLISSYAKSTGKTPYWSFVAVLNAVFSLFVMARWLWRDQPKQDKIGVT